MQNKKKHEDTITKTDETNVSLKQEEAVKVENKEAAGYEPERKEDLDHYHVRIEQPIFSTRDGSRISAPQMVMFSKEDWDKPMITQREQGKKKDFYMKDWLASQGYTVEVLYEPKKKGV